MSKSKIEWTESTWNPIAGCSHISEGCRNCYAERMSVRQMWMEITKHSKNPKHNPETWMKYSKVIHAGTSKWNGKIFCDEKALDKPLHWRKPRRIFVCSMSDLFHEKVPFEFIDKVMAVVIMCHQHNFQFLTKRAKRMLEYFSRPKLWTRILPEAISMSLWFDKGIQEPIPSYIDFNAVSNTIRGPLPNLQIGVTCENQKAADERIPILLQIPAAVRFVSFEPMLGPIDLRCIIGDPRRRCVYDCLRGQAAVHNNVVKDPVCGKIDWVIVGGESGPGARPMHPDWVRSIRDQCIAADVPFFFKQWGKFVAPNQTIYSGHHDGWRFPVGCSYMKYDGTYYPGYPSGGPSAWTKIYRIGKKKAGCLLDGKEWKQCPK